MQIGIKRNVFCERLPGTDWFLLSKRYRLFISPPLLVCQPRWVIKIGARDVPTSRESTLVLDRCFDANCRQNINKTLHLRNDTPVHTLRMYWKKLSKRLQSTRERTQQKLSSAKTVAVEVSLEVAFVNFSASNYFAQTKLKITCFHWCGAVEGCHRIDSAAAATSLIRRNNHGYRWTVAQRDACFPEAINAFLPSVVIGNQMSEARCLKLVAQFSSPSSARKQLN